MDLLRTYIRTITAFSEESWEVLLPCLTAMECKRHDFLLKEGQVCQAVYFVCKGLCKSFYNIDGKEINTAFYFENEFATNVTSLTTATPSEYAIKTIEKMTVVRIDKTRLLAAYHQSHQVETFGRKVLEQIIARQEAHTDSFKLLTPRQRFDNLVASHPDLLQRVSLTQIASYLGISRETLSRFRAKR